MKIIITPIFRYLLVLLLALGFFEGKAVDYTVNSTANTNTGAGTTGTLWYCLALANVAPGAPHTINITATGTCSMWSVSIVQPMTINSNVNFVIDATLADLTTNQMNGWQYDIVNIESSNVTINDLIVKNGKLNGWGGSGFVTLNGKNNITLNRCEATGCAANGYMHSNWADPGTTQLSSNYTFNTCNFSNNKSVGALFNHVDVVKITNGTFNNNGAQGILFNNQGVTNGAGVTMATGVTNSVIDGITCNANGTLTPNSGSGIHLDGKSINNSIKNSSSNFNFEHGVFINSSSNNTVDKVIANNNGISTKGGGIILLNQSNFCVIQNCTTNTNYQHGIWLRIDNDNNQILNNVSNDNGNTGSLLGCGINISLSNNTNNLVKGNTANLNHDFGIYLYDNYGTNGNNLNFIEGNTVTLNKSHGINIFNSNKTVIRNNYVGTDNTYANGLGNKGDGIHYKNSSTGGEMSGNVVINNSKNGIYITAGIDETPANPPLEKLIPKGGSNDNYIFNNYVGIDKNGVAKPNLMDGIVISESFGNIIGRSAAAPDFHLSSPLVGIVSGTLYKNYISGNGLNGISLNNIDPNNTSLNPKAATLLPTVIEGNYIGTNLLGTGAIANGVDGIGTLNSATSKVSRVSIIDNLISGNTDDGIQLGGSNSLTAATDLIAITGNTIGLNLAKTTALANGGHGINLVSTTNVAIGDNTATAFSAKSNIISGNVLNGIEITNSAKDIDVYYNRIGTDATGKIAMPNTIGISMTGANNNNLIGNLISGNTSHGINVFQASGLTNPNTISKNVIGTNEDSYSLVAATADAALALPNGGNGINLDNCNKNIIGGATPTTQNLISGNTGNGIAITNNSDFNQIDANIIGLNSNGNASIPNGKNGIDVTALANNNTIGTVSPNYISGNTDNGIQLNGANNNTIAKNIIGFGKNGSTIYSNGKDGISLTGSSTNTIGGPLSTDGNTIAGNIRNGISMLAASNSNTISNNLIGTSISGTGAPAGVKQVFGVEIDASHGNTLSFNTVGNNSAHGISLLNSGSVALPNVIKSNMVGVGKTGVGAVANAGNGIHLSNSSNNMIGGTLAADKNVVAGNTGIGINLVANSNSNTVENNYVGTNVGGTAKFANSVGISLTSANSNKILSNLVSGNTGNGIALAQSGSTGPIATGNGNTINSNTIGFTSAGGVLANGSNGIYLTQSSYNTIGATSSGNVIGNNAKDGIALVNTSTNNAIAYNTVGLNAGKNAKAANKNGITVTSSNTNNINNNTISGNTNDGLVLDASNTNTVSANIVGTSAALATNDLGNGATGISLLNGAASNTVGTTNTVAYNLEAIVVDGATTIQNKISQNSVYCNLSNNTVPGIHLKAAGNINFVSPWISGQTPGLDTLGKALVMGGFTAALGSTVEIFKKDDNCNNCTQGKTYVGSTTIVAASPILNDPLQGFVYNFPPATSLKKVDCDQYIVTVTDPAGNTSHFSTCSGCTQTCIPSTIATHPADKTVCESQTGVTLTGSSSKPSDTNYSWEKWNKVTLQYDSLIDASVYSGLTTNALGIIGGIPLSMNGDTLRFKVFTCGGFIYSNKAVIHIDTLPKITQDPTDKFVCIGASHTFTSKAIGTNVTYQWEVSTNGGLIFNPVVPAANNPDLTLTNIPFSSHQYQYRVKLGGKCTPSTNVYSAVATLRVDTATTISKDPKNSTVCLGNPAGFKVSALGRFDALGVSDIKYQWQVDSTGAFQNIAGETNDTLTVNTYNSVIGMSNFKYQVIATGTCGSTTSAVAKIIFTTSPSLTTSPTSLPFCEGTNTSLTGVIANASSYKWEVSADSATWTTVTGSAIYSTVNTQTLTLTNVPLSFNRYRFRLTGIGACAPDITTLEVILNVNEKASITTQPVAALQCEGDLTTSFNVVAKGAGLSYQWQESVNNGAFSNVTPSAKYVVTNTATTSKLDISPVDSAMNLNKYQVEVTGTCSTPTSTAVLLTVNTKAKIAAPANAKVCENDKTILMVAVKGTGFTVQWEKFDGVSAYVPLSNVSPYSGVTNDTLTITNPSNTLSGSKYRAVASTTGFCVTSVTSSDAVLTVDTIPTVTNPSDITICEGTPTSFTATATGTATTYQWQASYNGGVSYVNIGNGGVYSGTTTTTLNVLSPTYSMNNYLYRVMIDGKCKQDVPSNSAKLTVNEKPRITIQPISDTVCENFSSSFKVTATGTSLVFNWEKSTDGGLVWSAVAPTSSTATTSTLTINAVTLAMANDLYRAVVTNTSACSTATAVTSNAVGFQLTNAPAITQHPVGVNICVAATASFQVDATPADGSLTFDWQVQKVGDPAFVSVPNNPINPQVFDVVADASYANAKVQVVVTGACAPVRTSTVALIKFVIPTVTLSNLNQICSGTTTDLQISFPDATTSVAWGVSIPAGLTVSGVMGNTVSGVNGLVQSIKETYTNTGGNAVVSYTITPRSATGCLGVPQTANVTVLAPTQPTLKGATNICPGTPYTLTTQQFKFGKYAWYADNVLLPNDTTNTLAVIMGANQQDYTVIFTDTCGNSYSADSSLVPIYPVEVKFDVPTKVCSDFPAIFESHVVSSNKAIDAYVWNFGLNQSTATVDSSITKVDYSYADAGTYNVKLQAYFKGCLIGDTITPVTIQDCSIKAPNVFTPNGDGANDTWFIENIEYYPNASVSIFNRWGVIVWTATNGYVNQWDGRNTEKQMLEEGTFYYIIDLNSGDKKSRIKKGYITLLRDNK